MNATTSMIKNMMVPESQIDNVMSEHDRNVSLKKIRNYVDVALFFDIEVSPKRLQQFLYERGLAVTLERITDILKRDPEINEMYDRYFRSAGCWF